MGRLGLGYARRRLGGSGAFDPASLFGGGATGAWYDPSDLSSMFQDSAGTTPAAVGQPVGRINDKSGNGNHAIQATTAAKPILRQSGARYYLELDGVDDGMVATLGANITGAAASGFFAGRYDTGANNFIRFVCIGEAAAQSYDSLSYMLLSFLNAGNVLPVYNNVNGPTTALAADTDVVITTGVTATNLTVKKDAGATTSAAHGVSPALNAPKIFLGIDSTSANSLRGRIDGVLVINRTLTGTEASNLTTYLGAKQGRTL